MTGYTLTNAHEIMMLYPDTFHLPPTDNIKEGAFVKLIFDDGTSPSEKMWVEVKSRDGDNFTGVLRNCPFKIKGIFFGDPLEFEAKHICQIDGEMIQ